jgi:hypothetical protein
VLRLAVGIWTGAGVVTAGLIAALTFAVTVDRGLSAEELGFILSAYGIGNLIGAVSGGRFTRGPLAPPLLGGYLVQALAIAAVGIPGSLPLVFLLGAAFLGGVGSTARTISIGLQPIGMFATGILLDTVGGNVTVLVTGLGLLALTVLFALSPTLRAAHGGVHAEA